MRMRALSGAEAMAVGVTGVAMSGDVDAPAVEIADYFNFQSYFDNTLLEKAIARQTPNEPIVTKTKTVQDLSGYALGLHPSSDAPVAVTFKGGQQQGSSAVFRLKPGQIIRPFGSPGGKGGKFSGFEYGLPFGWLGGGNVLLVVLRTADANVDWGDDRVELIYHRTRMKIQAAPLVAPTTPYNWPTRFPWPKAASGSNALAQVGAPVLSVTPTRTLLRLRMSSLASAASMRAYFVGTDALDEDQNGTVGVTTPACVDVTWGSWAPIAGDLPNQYQTQMFTGELERLGANNGWVLFVDGSAGLLANQYVDVVRYGVL